jgi:hypothetical protein
MVGVPTAQDVIASPHKNIFEFTQRVLRGIVLPVGSRQFKPKSLWRLFTELYSLRLLCIKPNLSQFVLPARALFVDDCSLNAGDERSLEETLEVQHRRYYDDLLSRRLRNECLTLFELWKGLAIEAPNSPSDFTGSDHENVSPL